MIAIFVRVVPRLGALAIVLAGAPRAAAAADDPSQARLAYRAGKAARNDAEARVYFQHGIDLARRKLRATPDDPDGLLWLAANLGGEALTHGRVHALGAIPEIEATLLRLEQTHPDYDHAAAARGLANLYWKAPSLISVGSTRKASKYFELALARAADYPGNQAMAAAFFADRDDCGRARPLAQAVQNRKDLSSFGPDAVEWRRLADTALRDCP